MIEGAYPRLAAVSTFGVAAVFIEGGGQQGATCVLPWRCPVYRWRELVAGAGMEQENLSPGTDARRPTIGPTELALDAATRAG